MISFLPVQFETLKSRVLANANIRSITPGDCKALALQIYVKTKLTLSETTLKRVYGFAYSKFKPSLFTIDVMAKYCDYAGWDDFCNKQSHQIVKTTDSNTNWQTLKHQADKITNFTLQALKNKAGIPYNLTVKRQFVNKHFDTFVNENFVGTALCSPAGYGKTLALCHWVDEKLTAGIRG